MFAARGGCDPPWSRPPIELPCPLALALFEACYRLIRGEAASAHRRQRVPYYIPSTMPRTWSPQASLHAASPDPGCNPRSTVCLLPGVLGAWVSASLTHSERLDHEPDRRTKRTAAKGSQRASLLLVQSAVDPSEQKTLGMAAKRNSELWRPSATFESHPYKKTDSYTSVPGAACGLPPDQKHWDTMT